MNKLFFMLLTLISAMSMMGCASTPGRSPIDPRLKGYQNATTVMDVLDAVYLFEYETTLEREGGDQVGRTDRRERMSSGMQLRNAEIQNVGLVRRESSLDADKSSTRPRRRTNITQAVADCIRNRSEVPPDLLVQLKEERILQARSDARRAIANRRLTADRESSAEAAVTSSASSSKQTQQSSDASMAENEPSGSSQEAQK